MVVQYWVAGTLAVRLLAVRLLIEMVMMVELLAAGIPMADLQVALKLLVELLVVG